MLRVLLLVVVVVVLLLLFDGQFLLLSPLGPSVLEPHLGTTIRIR